MKRMLLLLIVQAAAMMCLAFWLYSVERRLAKVTEILVNHENGLKAVIGYECNQQGINYVFNKQLNGDKPYYRPLVVDQGCKTKAESQ